MTLLKRRIRYHMFFGRFCFTHLHQSIRKISSGYKSSKLQLLTERGVPFPDYALGNKEFIPSDVIIHGKESVDNLRNACLIARKILQDLKYVLVPGISTNFVEKRVMELCWEHKVYPSPLLYKGYPW